MTTAHGDQPEADVLEQAAPIEDEEIPRPERNPEEVSEADWAEQSIEVPLDEDDDHDRP